MTEKPVVFCLIFTISRLPTPPAAGCFKFGFLFMAKIYMVPYWINVMWLDVVTYLHHTDKEVTNFYQL